MASLLRQVLGDFFKRRVCDPASRSGGVSGRDWLPPVLAPSDWSNSLLQAMADSDAAWYFDRALGSNDRSERA